MQKLHSKKKLKFIINPKSGTKCKKKIEKLIIKYIDRSKYDFDICYTKAPKHATTLSDEATKLKYDLVVAVGGDGTINEISKALIGKETCLGIIPMGSGNGLASHLKIPKKAKKAIEIINNFKFKLIDTLQINDHPFLAMVGIGFDAHVAHAFSKLKKRGFLSYASIVIKDAFFYKSKIFELFLDGKKYIKKGFLFSFANISQYGNNIIISPHAKIDDGFFRVTLLKRPAFLRSFSTFLQLRNKTIYKSKYFESIKVKEAIIKQKNIVAHIDGEPVFFENGIKIKVFEKPLKIIVP
ncbi:MAG: Diacylglycerol kinase [Candidatus Anoxychlamydiales bacterium]|nr:Diacylglycerol kinase [Candidatus Anoxychlamydiales bacterium]NGX35984.1 Diacylglycerol kinase [Candidatus Anoxychlamydiales bacterium]